MIIFIGRNDSSAGAPAQPWATGRVAGSRARADARFVSMGGDDVSYMILSMCHALGRARRETPSPAGSNRRKLAFRALSPTAATLRLTRTYTVLLLSHSDEVISGRTGATCEHDRQFTPAQNRLPPGAGPAHHALWLFAAAGLPIFAAGPANRWTLARARSEGRLHREASPAAHRAGPPASTTAAVLHQSVGRTGSAPLADSTQTPWLSGKASEYSVAKSTPCLIVMGPRKWPKCTAGWCRPPRRLRWVRQAVP